MVNDFDSSGMLKQRIERIDDFYGQAPEPKQQIKAGTAADVGIQPELPPVIDEFFDELLRVHALELRNIYSSHYQDNLFLGDQLAKDIAFDNTLSYFIDKVKKGGDWDLKNRLDLPLRGESLYYGTIYSGEDLGNIHFGYVGAVLFPKGILHAGAGAYQMHTGINMDDWASYFDSPRDYEMVEYGWKLYHERNG